MSTAHVGHTYYLIHFRVLISTSLYIYLYIYTHAYIHTYIHTYIYIYSHTYVFVYIDMCSRVL